MDLKEDVETRIEQELRRGVFEQTCLMDIE